MLDAAETTAAVDAIPYPRMNGMDKDERLAALLTYREKIENVHRQFGEWLANEHASGLPKAVQDRIWKMAWDEGHAYGYNEVETHYIDYAEFAEFVFNAK